MATEPITFFPPAIGLNPGDYFVIAQQTGQVVPFTTRKLTAQNMAAYLAPIIASSPEIQATVAAAVEFFFANLPTTLPSQPNVAWNNGGFVSIS